VRRIVFRDKKTQTTNTTDKHQQKNEGIFIHATLATNKENIFTNKYNYTIHIS
jgi:hypothetical protein